jgi:hypothetical protein
MLNNERLKANDMIDGKRTGQKKIGMEAGWDSNGEW